jgi:hypothetical protein
MLEREEVLEVSSGRGSPRELAHARILLKADSGPVLILRPHPTNAQRVFRVRPSAVWHTTGLPAP